VYCVRELNMMCYRTYGEFCRQSLILALSLYHKYHGHGLDMQVFYHTEEFNCCIHYVDKY